jgi:hypothetical protein
MSEATEKPKCGGGGASLDDYDLPLHAVAVREYTMSLTLALNSNI